MRQLFEEARRRLEVDRQAMEDEIRIGLHRAGEKAIARIALVLERQENFDSDDSISLFKWRSR